MPTPGTAPRSLSQGQQRLFSVMKATTFPELRLRSTPQSQPCPQPQHLPLLCFVSHWKISSSSSLFIRPKSNHWPDCYPFSRQFGRDFEAEIWNMNLVKISEEKCGQDFEVSVLSIIWAWYVVKIWRWSLAEIMKVKFGQDLETGVWSRFKGQDSEAELRILINLWYGLKAITLMRALNP